MRGAVWCRENLGRTRPLTQNKIFIFKIKFFIFIKQIKKEQIFMYLYWFARFQFVVTFWPWCKYISEVECASRPTRYAEFFCKTAGLGNILSPIGLSTTQSRWLQKSISGSNKQLTDDNLFGLSHPQRKYKEKKLSPKHFSTFASIVDQIVERATLKLCI